MLYFIHLNTDEENLFIFFMGRCIVSGEGFYFFLSDNYHERFDTDQGINLEWPK